jgi:predicted RNA-binding Zn-ribbon protein involved in translation (DUF1610 family)
MRHRISLNALLEACQADDNRGFCLNCGAEAYNVEPDAKRYTCPDCGEPDVYGAEEILIMTTA